MEKELFEKRKKVLADLIADRHYVPMKVKELAILLNVEKKDRAALQEVLDALVREGKIGLTKRGKYVKAEDKAIVGEFTANERGFGFVTVEGMDQDIFIPAKDVNGAFHKDTVLLLVTSPATKDKRSEGRILKVLKHNLTEIVGTFQKNKSYGFVVPDDKKITKDIFVLSGKSNGAVTGHKVIVKIKDYGGDRHNPEGVITQILGHINDPGVDILSIIKGYDLPVEFPKDVMDQVATVPSELSAPDYEGRRDLRDLLTVTIDGEDAKDLDDAVTLEKKGDHYLLGVHIADVTHYVTEKSALDKEALKRGTSVYLVDRVIPMLPHALSNGICSLNQGTDRLAMSCLMEFDANGKQISHEVTESVIRVNHRMSYTGVNAILTDEHAKEREEFADVVPMLLEMNQLACILREQRHKRGAIDFDFPESKVILDEQGKPLQIKPYERNLATRLIEDFMLAANETIAQHYYWQEIPFLYRSHEEPAEDKMHALAAFLGNMGYTLHLSQGKIYPMEIQKLLSQAAGTEEEPLISRVCLRSMKQAKYTTESASHFGLAAPYYCHFTSPIRRYPDLQIHRIIKENLKGKLDEKEMFHFQQILPEVARHASETERRADEAERDTIKTKKVEYMEQFIGQEFTGVISGVTAWGLYVELPNTVEGMIHISRIKGDYYIFDEPSYTLVGEHTKKTYKLGQKLKVVVMGADKLQRIVDFDIVEEVSGNEASDDEE